MVSVITHQGGLILRGEEKGAVSLAPITSPPPSPPSPPWATSSAPSPSPRHLPVTTANLTSPLSLPAAHFHFPVLPHSGSPFTQPSPHHHHPFQQTTVWKPLFACARGSLPRVVAESGSTPASKVPEQTQEHRLCREHSVQYRGTGMRLTEGAEQGASPQEGGSSCSSSHNASRTAGGSAWVGLRLGFLLM